MRKLRRWLSAVTVVTAAAGAASDVGGAQGLIQVNTTFTYHIDQVPGLQTIKADGPNLQIIVGVTVNDIVQVTGPITRTEVPTPGVVGMTSYPGFFPIHTLNSHSASTDVPNIGDVSFLGGTFKTKQEVQGQVNLLIFITPHIVTTPDKSAPAKKKPAFVEIGGPLDLTAASIVGNVKTDKSSAHIKGAYTVKFVGTVQTGPYAGRACKGKLKLSLKGDRT